MKWFITHQSHLWYTDLIKIYQHPLRWRRCKAAVFVTDNIVQMHFYQICMLNNCRNTLRFCVCYYDLQNKYSGCKKRTQTHVLSYNVLALKQECIMLSSASQMFWFHSTERTREEICISPNSHNHESSQAWKVTFSAFSFLFCGLPPAKLFSSLNKHSSHAWREEMPETLSQCVRVLYIWKEEQRAVHIGLS